MSDIFDKYPVGELVAVQWNDDMAARFPNADHSGCTCLYENGKFVACRGLHCNRCGAPTDCQGGHYCPDRPA